MSDPLSTLGSLGADEVESTLEVQIKLVDL